LPSVAPVAEVEEKPMAPGLTSETLEALRRKLQEAVDTLQEALDQLKRIAPEDS
jgi:hypothetical protein